MHRASVGAILGPPANLDQAISGLLVAFRFDRVPIWTTSVQADGARVGVVKTSQDGRVLDCSPGVIRLYREAFVESSRDTLPDALMRSGAVVVVGVLLDDEMQLAAMQDEHMVQTFSLLAAHEPLAVGAYLGYVGFRRPKRRFQLLDASASGDGRELLTILAVAVMDEVSWPFSPRSGLAQITERPIRRWEKR